METIRSAEQCVRAEMLAWVSYPDEGRKCFVYPQYLLDSHGWKDIDGSAFPNNGGFLGVLTGSAQLSEIHELFGQIVVARVNADRFDQNLYYEREKPLSAYYRLAFNPSFAKGISEFEFDVFSDHALSAELIQIVDIRNTVSLNRQFSEPVTIDDDVNNLVCRFILVCDSTGKYFGPFEYAKKGNKAIELISPSANDYRIAHFDNLSDSPALIIRDEYGSKRCSFIEKRIISEMFDHVPENEKLDWIPQQELLDVVTRAINASDEFSDFSKSQIRSIKSAIWNYSDNTGRLMLDGPRKKRIVDWLSEVDSWTDLPEQITRGVADSIADEKILDLVLDERNFPLFRDKVMESAGVQDYVAVEKKRLESSLSDIKRQRDEAMAEKEEAVRDAKEAQLKASEARKQLEKVRDEALEQKREELNGLEKSIIIRQEELANLEEDYERAIVNKNKIERDVERIISGINDEVATSTKILENELLRKVIAAVSGFELNEEDETLDSRFTALRQDENDMTDDEIVDVIYDSINQRAGRQVSRNDTVNLMICLTQGYITTFAGLPGTGKTSLCNILAGALGLKNGDAGKRFTEINVENGWTSYKDYVGYYNPLAKTYEKSNASVFDAMRLLSKEAADAAGAPPYIFLLDEANLSPIEHYWSPFLRACDTFQENGARISLGGTENWCLPNTVRFLATVNFDHTTEALSHRFLDRSWVITLDPDYIDPDFGQVDTSKEFATELAFSSNRLTKAFGITDSDMPNQDNMTLLDDLIRICRSHSFSISPRSQLMIRKYIATASRLMSLQSKDSQYAPLDYAFSQKVLPQLAGPAETVGDLINDLADECQQLIITKKQLDRMKVLGNDSGFYQYFV